MSATSRVALTVMLAAGVLAWMAGGLLFWLVVTDPWAVMELMAGLAPAGSQLR